MGLRRKGECGHEQVAVIAQFWLCVTMPECDGKPGERCERCSSKDLYPFEAAHMPPNTMACRNCGAVRWSGVR